MLPGGVIDGVDYDDIPAAIGQLHDKAEDLAALAKHSDASTADKLRRQAQALVREAASLRAQIEEDRL